MRVLFLLVALAVFSAALTGLWVPAAYIMLGVPDNLIPKVCAFLITCGLILLLIRTLLCSDAVGPVDVGIQRVDRARAPKVADFVFIHGLGGDSTSTWSKDSGVLGFWPSWLAEEYPELGVWTVQYDTAISKWRKCSLTIDQRSLSIGELLVAKWSDSDGFGKRPIYFVAHSMGGIFVKEILRMGSVHGGRYAKLLDLTKGVVFLGTPHKGSYLASFITNLNKSRLLRVNADVEELRVGAPKLEKLDKWFAEHAAKKGIDFVKCFYECKPIKVWFIRTVKVVEEEFAVPELPTELCVPIPLGADHREISKPVSRESPMYISIKSFIEDSVRPHISNP